MLYLAYKEPDWDGENRPEHPVIYGIFTSLDKVIALLANKPKERYSDYFASCDVKLIQEDLELPKKFSWFDGVFVSGSWAGDGDYEKGERERVELELLKNYNVNS